MPVNVTRRCVTRDTVRSSLSRDNSANVALRLATNGPYCLCTAEPMQPTIYIGWPFAAEHVLPTVNHEEAERREVDSATFMIQRPPQLHMRALTNTLRRFRSKHRKDERGATLVLVAIGMTMFLAAGGFSVDLGRTVVVNRSLQSVADEAALDAGRYISIPETTVLPSTTDNLVVHANNAAANNGAGATIAVTQGIWSNGQFTQQTPTKCKGTTPPSGNIPCNAVQVTASTGLTHLFSSGSSTLSRSAVAVNAPQAGYSIGPYLTPTAYNNQAQVSAVLNNLLGLIGNSARLTKAGYSGLSDTYVSIQQLINVSNGVLTPSNVLNTSLPISTWDSYLSSAVTSQAALLSCGNVPEPLACSANDVLIPFTGATGSLSGTSLPLCKIVSISSFASVGPSTCGSQLPQASLSASVDVLQTLITEAELANAGNPIDMTTALNITNAGNGVNPIPATLTLSVVSPPQIAYGPLNASANSGVVNATLTLSLTISGVSQTLNIPVAGAAATATISTAATSSAITCPANSLFTTKISASAAASGPNAVTLNGTQVATLNLASFTPSVLSFGNSTYVPPTVSTDGSTLNKNPNPLSSTAPSISFSSISGGLPSLVSSLLGTSGLQSTTMPNLLQSLGLQPAATLVADLGTNCVAVSLVQ